jgi:hypothetical protein
MSPKQVPSKIPLPFKPSSASSKKQDPLGKVKVNNTSRVEKNRRARARCDDMSTKYVNYFGNVLTNVRIN